MIDLWTMEGLLRNIKNSTLGLIGDVDQLPSVRCGSILRDLIQSEAVPCVQLDTIHRQSADALNICENAQNIKNGVHNLNTGDDFHIVEAEDLETLEYLNDVLGIYNGSTLDGLFSGITGGVDDDNDDQY